MAKVKLAVPKNCPLEIWVSDVGDEGCFAIGSVRLPDESGYRSFKKSDGSEILIPNYIEIDFPEGTTPRTKKFYYFAKGNFNAAFRYFPVNDEKDANDATSLLLFPPIMLKFPLGGTTGVTAQLDAAGRAVRVFNECNRKALAIAAENSSREPGKHFFGQANVMGNGWLAPYIIGQQSTSEQICKRLIQLFNDTQRIVVDSYVENNLLTDESNTTWIIDSGFALQLGLEDPVDDDEKTGAKRQRPPKSKASFCAWSAEEGRYSEHYGRHFLKLLFPTEYNQKFSPAKQGEIKKISSIPPQMQLSMALLYIQKKYPEVRDVSCLETNRELIQYFTAAYIQQIRQQHFSDSREMIPTLNINKDMQKLTGINEPDEKLAQLKKETIDLIETTSAQVNEASGSLEALRSSVNQLGVSGFSFQETQNGEVSPHNQSPVEQQHQPKMGLRTTEFRHVKTEILRKINQCVYQDERYAGIPSLSLEEPVGNIDILRGTIQSSRNFEDMRNRLTQLSNTKDVKSKPKLLALYNGSLESIRKLEPEFIKAYTKQYGEHANKLVPLKMELERQILNDTKTIAEQAKEAAQLIENINRCENESDIINKIKESKINATCLISCCNIVMKPIFKKYPDDLKYCNNKYSMINLYSVRKKADETKGAYEAAKNPSENPNARLIAQLGKIKAELEYRKTLYEIRGAKNEKSWWPWSTSINTKLFATEEMLKYINKLQARIDPKSSSSTESNTTLPNIYATSEGKLGDIFKEITSSEMISAFNNATRLSAANLSAFQSVNQADTKKLLKNISVSVYQKADLDLFHAHLAGRPIILQLKSLQEKNFPGNFQTQQELVLFVLETLFPDESSKILVGGIPKEQLVSHKITLLQKTFRAELENNKLLALVIEETREQANSDFVRIIDSLIGADPVDNKTATDDPLEEEPATINDELPVDENRLRNNLPDYKKLYQQHKNKALPELTEDQLQADEEPGKADAQNELAAWRASDRGSRIKELRQTDPLVELKKEVINTLFPNTNQHQSTSLSPIIDTSSAALQSIRQRIVNCDSVDTLLNLLTTLKSQSAAMPSQQQFDTCIETIKKLCPEPVQIKAVDSGPTSPHQ